ncbi:neuronatin-like isoform X2 [Tenrec ecaudatus]|uniref:neuronatin-like isoform X2 n=1 Tax=Tenrec ecaudatus TaxID=94439 RepID=UPI003F59E6EA
MAALAAVSAGLLIIAWYIFRVLLHVFLEHSLQKLAYTVSRTGRQVLGERKQQAPN